MAQFEVGGISGLLLVFPGVIALTHEWTDFVRLFVRRLVAVSAAECDSLDRRHMGTMMSA